MSSQLSTYEKIGLLFKYFDIRLKKRPIMMTLEVTKHCNAHCDFCDHWKTKKETRLEDYLPVVKRINPLVVTISGGEPTLLKDLPQIIQRIRENMRFIYITLLTNGSLMTVEKAQNLCNSGLNITSFSLNYLDDRQDKERGIDGLLSHLSNLIPQLRDAGINVTLNTVIMKDNLDQLALIAKQAHQWQIKVGYSCYEILQANNPAHLIREDQFNELQQVITELLHLKSALNSITNSRYYLKNVITFYKNGGHLSGCQAKQKFIHVSSDGYLKPCANMPAYMHYSEYKANKKQPEPVGCDQCWEACRGEMEASLTFERVWELVAHFPYA